MKRFSLWVAFLLLLAGAAFSQDCSTLEFIVDDPTDPLNSSCATGGAMIASA